MRKVYQHALKLEREKEIAVGLIKQAMIATRNLSVIDLLNSALRQLGEAEGKE
jgi:hypothetical protein